MPSSELPRIHLRCWTRLANRLESLLLGMLKPCVQTVDQWSTSLVQVRVLSTQYTGTGKYLTAQVFFVHRLYSAVEHFLGAYKQPFSPIFNLLLPILYTLSTTPTNTNKLYKGLYYEFR